MKSALSNQSFYDLNRGKHLSQIFGLPRNEATVYVSTHFELGDSDLLHYHDEPHLAFILSGGVVDKRKNVEIERMSGELVFFHAGEPHQTISKLFPTKYVSLQFQSDFFKQNPTIETTLKSSFKKSPKAKFSMLKIYKELTINDEFSESSMEMLLLNLIEDGNAAKFTRPNWLNKIVELLNDNWNEELSLDDLAKSVKVHPKTISKYFPRAETVNQSKPGNGEYLLLSKTEHIFAKVDSYKQTAELYGTGKFFQYAMQNYNPEFGKATNEWMLKMMK